MKFYLAPLEGITGYVYRNAYEKSFHNMNRYFTPFISANMHHSLKTREERDLAIKNNQGMEVVPQIIGNHAEDINELCKMLYYEYGYKEVNLNLGCPAGTVV